MRVGRVCARHEQWCPDGVCPYCEPAPTLHLHVRTMLLSEDIVRMLGSTKFREAMWKERKK